MSRIAVLGTACQEVYMIDHDDLGGEDCVVLPRDSIIEIDRAGFSVGGGGANVAVSAARFGHETIFIGNLAHDAAGEAVVRCFDEENIDTSYIAYQRGATGCNVVLLDSRTARSTVMSYQGVSGRASNLDATDLDSIQPDFLYVSSLAGDLDKISDFFQQAKALDAKIMWNPGLAELKHPQKAIELLRNVDILLVNKHEAAGLVPGVILTELLSRLANYCETVIITDGEMGAIATDHQSTYRLGVYEQKNLRDRLGAGDAFGGGFLAAAADGRDFASALQFASANASKVTQHYGTNTAALGNDIDLHPMPIVEIKDLTTWGTKEQA